MDGGESEWHDDTTGPHKNNNRSQLAPFRSSPACNLLYRHLCPHLGYSGNTQAHCLSLGYWWVFGGCMYVQPKKIVQFFFHSLILSFFLYSLSFFYALIHLFFHSCRRWLMIGQFSQLLLYLCQHITLYFCFSQFDLSFFIILLNDILTALGRACFMRWDHSWAAFFILLKLVSQCYYAIYRPIPS